MGDRVWDVLPTCAATTTYYQLLCILKTTMYTYYCSTCTCEVKGLVGMMRVTLGGEHGPKVESVKADR